MNFLLTRTFLCKKVFFLFPLLLVFIFSACNNPDDSSTVQKAADADIPSTAHKDTADEKETKFGSLYVLYLTEREFIDLNQAREAGSIMAFQFCLEDFAAQKLTLGAWPAKKDGKFTRGSQKLLTISDEVGESLANRKVYLSTQKLMDNQITQIISDLNQGGDQVVLFVPNYNRGNNQIFYTVFVQDNIDNLSDKVKKLKEKPITTDDDLIVTNPSPPATFSDVLQ